MVINIAKCIQNTGSTARDWCMLERNILSHLKLCILLSLLAASVLLRAGLTGSDDNSHPDRNPGHLIHSGFTVALVLEFSGLLALVAGSWEYWSSDRDMRTRRAFMIVSKPHVAMMTVVSGIVFGLCLVFLADRSIT